MKTSLHAVMIGLCCLLTSGCQEDDQYALEMDTQTISYYLEMSEEPRATMEPSALTLKAGDFSGPEGNFRISLLDANENGTFNEVGADKIFVSQYGLDTLGWREGGMMGDVIAAQTTIRVNDEVFLVDKVAEDGTSIQLKRNGTDIPSPYLSIIDRLPEREFPLLMGGKSKFEDHLKAGNLTLVLFWGDWCMSCKQMLTELEKFYLEYGQNLQVVLLNAKDEVGVARNYVLDSDYRMRTWVHGLATDRLIDQFLVTGYPYAVLFNNKGELVKLGANMDDIQQEILTRYYPSHLPPPISESNQKVLMVPREAVY
ncbi:MAG: thioredoxin-like domain-containing protein [Bacteroidota bacterium]